MARHRSAALASLTGIGLFSASDQARDDALSAQNAHSRSDMQTHKLTTQQRRAAARVWDRGGHLSLGLWLSRWRPHFSVNDYAAAVQAAREELNDDTDYSVDAAARGTREGASDDRV